MTKAGLAKLQRVYLKAKKDHLAMELLEKQLKNKVLSENVYMIEEEHANGRAVERIIRAESDFLMSDVDFEDYCQKLYQEAISARINLPDSNHTFTWETYPALKNAENNLLDWVRKNVPGERPELTKESIEKMASHWKYRQELIDLTLQLQAG